MKVRKEETWLNASIYVNSFRSCQTRSWQIVQSTARWTLRKLMHEMRHRPISSSSRRNSKSLRAASVLSPRYPWILSPYSTSIPWSTGSCNATPVRRTKLWQSPMSRPALWSLAAFSLAKRGRQQSRNETTYHCQSVRNERGLRKLRFWLQRIISTPRSLRTL